MIEGMMKMALKPARLLDPKNDIVFKKIFGENIDLLLSFLNSVLPLEGGQKILSLSYLPHEQAPRIPSMKNTIIDVKCTDNLGRIFIVEMQMEWNRHFKKRLLFGTSKAYVQQLGRGENYASLCPVYGLGLINDIFDSKSEEWFHHYRSVNVKDSTKVLEGLELLFIELPKFKPQSWSHRKLGLLWLRFFKEMNEQTQEVPQEFLDDPELLRAVELTQESSYTKAELEAYDQYWDAVSVEKTVYTAGEEIGLKKGEEIGLKKGEEIGIKKGEEIGFKKGEEIGEQRGIRTTALTIALTMIAEGIDLPLISKITGLSLSELHSMKAET